MSMSRVSDSRHDREEKVRHTRERQEEERLRKIKEFRETNDKAAELRRKQDNDRQRKITEARQRELDRRSTVDERRKKLFQEENVSGRALGYVAELLHLLSSLLK